MKPGDRVKFKFFSGVTGTVVDIDTSTARVTVDSPIMDMEAGETAPISLFELELEEQ